MLDGKQLAETIYTDIASIRASLGPLTLAVVREEGNPATDSYVRIKARAAARLGIEFVEYTPNEMAEALHADGVVVQLPITNSEQLIAQIPLEKDVDALTDGAVVRPPVAEAMAAILHSGNIEVEGKKAVVVGAGRLVGVPVAVLLKDMGAEVEVVTAEQGSLSSLKEADIVVLGVGVPHMVTPEMLKAGVALIDAGTSDLPAGKAGQGGVVVGDADPRCAEVCSLFTPTPGGVGPVTVAMLFKNFLTLAKMKK